MATVGKIDLSVNIRGCKELCDLISALVKYQSVLPGQVIERMADLEAAVGNDEFYSRAVTVSPVEIGCNSINADAIADALKHIGAVNGR